MSHSMDTHQEHPAFNAFIQPLAGTVSVEASAGTGKTWSITLLWLRLLVEEKLDIGKVLVTTFTTAATAELKDRLLRILRMAKDAAEAAVRDGAAERPDPEKNPAAYVVWQALHAGKREPQELFAHLTRALSNFDQAPVSTIHGFCQRLIARHALELGVDPMAEVVASHDDIVDRLVEDQVMASAHAGRETGDIGALREVARKVAKETVGEVRPTLAELAQAEKGRAYALAEIRSLYHREALDKAMTGAKVNGGTKKAILSRLDQVFKDGVVVSFNENQTPVLDEHAPELRLAVEGYCLATAVCAHAARIRTAHALLPALRAEKSRRNLRTFDDILLAVAAVLDKQGAGGTLAQAVRGGYDAVIVDECQDTDAVQLAVFRTLFGGAAKGGAQVASFIVIGDPKQSIYRFRGADLRSYCGLREQAAETPDMKVNHRSDAALLAALNLLYGAGREFPGGGAAPIRYVSVSAPERHRAGRFRWKDFAQDAPFQIQWSKATNRDKAARDLANKTADEIGRLISHGEIVDNESKCWRAILAGDIAVLGNRRELRIVQAALETRGIPAALGGRGSGSVLAGEPAGDLLVWFAAMDALAQARDAKPNVRTFLVSPLRGMAAQAVQGITGADYARELAALRKSADTLRRCGPLAALVEHLGGRLADIVGHSGGERQVTDWRQVAEQLQEAWAAGARLPGDLSAELARRIGQAGKAAREEGDDDQAIRFETDRPAVKLVTVHASKGLEYPVVFCPFLWKVSKKAGGCTARAFVHGRQVLDIGSPDFAHVRAAEAADQAEEFHRTAYVALTRAKHRVYTGLACVKDGNGREFKPDTASPVPALLLGESSESLRAKTPADWQALLAARQAVLAQLPQAAAFLAPSVPVAAAASLELDSPPAVDPWSRGIDRTASYSSLKHKEDRLALDGMGFDDVSAATDLPAQSAAKDALAGLGAGTSFGTMVHAVFEKAVGEKIPLEQAIAMAGVKGDKRAAWQAQLAPILGQRVVTAGSAWSLAGISDAAVAEMFFLLPVKGISSQGLADALAVGEPSDSVRWQEWLARVPDLEFKELCGFLQGYMDLVFTHDGRWFVADYKTNSRVGDGSLPALEAEMASHDYFLQAHLYVLALHRHLKATLADYDYATHMGGATYLFLRAMGEEGGVEPGRTSRGVWHCLPPIERIEALDQLLEPMGIFA